MNIDYVSHVLRKKMTYNVTIYALRGLYIAFVRIQIYPKIDPNQRTFQAFELPGASASGQVSQLISLLWL